MTGESGIRRQELYLPRIEQSRLLMAWMGPGVEQLRSAYGLELAFCAASRRDGPPALVRELREEQQLVQTICVAISRYSGSMSLFTISAWLQPRGIRAS